MAWFSWEGEGGEAEEGRGERKRKGKRRGAEGRGREGRKTTSLFISLPNAIQLPNVFWISPPVTPFSATPVIFNLFLPSFLPPSLLPSLSLSLLIFSRGNYAFIDLREWKGGERERERNIRVRHKYQLVASYTRPNGGSNLKPRYVPWLGLEPASFCCMGWYANQLSHLARANFFISGHT